MDPKSAARFNQEETIKHMFFIAGIATFEASVVGVIRWFTNDLTATGAQGTLLTMAACILTLALIGEQRLKKGQSNGEVNTPSPERGTHNITHVR